MLRKIMMVTLFMSSLVAQEATEEQLNSIYQEAMLFVLIFGIMGIVSYIYSTKHAKEYAPVNTSEDIALKVESNSERRISKLLEMYRNDLLTQEEYKVLLQYHKSQDS